MLYYKWIFIEHCIVLLILASSTITYTLQNKDKFHLYSPSSCVVTHICYKMFYDYFYDVVKKFQMNVYAEWQELEGIGYQLRTHRTALGTSQSSSEAVLGQYFPYSLILYTLHLSECIMINVLLIFLLLFLLWDWNFDKYFLIRLNHWILYTVFKRKFLLFKFKEVFWGEGVLLFIDIYSDSIGT